jgi:hypothetical protein
MEGASICAFCDYIIDRSFLGEGYTDEPIRPANNQPEKSEKVDNPLLYEDTGKIVLSNHDKSPSSNPPSDNQSLKLPDSSRTSESPKKEDPAEKTSPIFKDVENILLKIWQSFLRHSVPDKLTIGGAAALLVFTLFPWVQVPGLGSRIGLELGGWVTLLCAAGFAALVQTRHHPKWYSFERPILYFQIGAASLLVLFLLVRMITIDWEDTSRVEGQFPIQFYSAEVSLGLVLCWVSSLVILVGSLLALRNQKQ